MSKSGKQGESERPSIPDAVHWYEGMLLEARHFRSFAERQDALGAYYARTASPDPWGVTEIECGLDNNVFLVTRLEGVTPLGRYFRYDPATQGPLSIELKDAQAKVYVEVYQSAADEDDERIDCEPVLEDSAEVVRSRPELKLVAKQERGDSEVIELARRMRDTEAITLDDTFVPPTPHSGASPWLREECGRFSKMIRLKWERAIQAGQPLDSAALSVRRWMAAQALASTWMQFEVVRTHPRSHPFELYRTVCALAGVAAMVSDERALPQFYPVSAGKPEQTGWHYDHSDIGAAFKRAMRYVDRRLEDVFPTWFDVHLFTRRSGREFALPFDPAWSGRGLYLKVRGERPDSRPAIQAWVEAARIGVESNMAALHDKRVSGIERRRVSAGEQGLVLDDRSLLFRLAAKPQELSGDALVLSNPSSHEPPASIALLVELQR